MHVFPTLVAIIVPVLGTLTGFGFRQQLVLERMNGCELRVEDDYDLMHSQILSAIFSGFDSGDEMPQDKVDAIARNVDLVIGRFKAQPTTEEAPQTDDAFSAILHELFVSNFIPNARKVGSISYSTLALYDRCLQSAELHGMVPHTAFPFLHASNRLAGLLSLINHAYSLEHGADVESISNTLALIRELCEKTYAIGIHSGSFISSLGSLRSQLVDGCRSFFAIVPEEPLMHQNTVMNAFNTFQTVENMLSMALSIALLTEENLDITEDVAEMAKAHAAHVVIGCVRRSVPTEVLVKNLTSASDIWRRGIVFPVYDYIFGNYPQDIFPNDAVSVPNHVEDATPSSTLEMEQVSEDASSVPENESVPEEPSSIYKGLVYGLPGLAAVMILATVPLYFLRRKSHE